MYNHYWRCLLPNWFYTTHKEHVCTAARVCHVSIMFVCGLLLLPHSHAVLAAEVVHHFLPKLVELHNYSPANSISQKLENWRTLNSECDVCR